MERGYVYFVCLVVILLCFAGSNTVRGMDWEDDGGMIENYKRAVSFGPSTFCQTLPQLENTFVLGGLYPQAGSLGVNGLNRMKGAQLAVDIVNNSTLLKINNVSYTLSLIFGDSNSNVITAPNALLPLILANYSIVGIIGEGSSAVSQAVAPISQFFQLPQISYSSTSASLSAKASYPYFTRVVSSDSVQGQALADLVRYYNFTQISVIYTNDLYGAGIYSVFKQRAQQIGLEILSFDQVDVSIIDATSVLNNVRAARTRVVAVFSLVNTASVVFQSALRLSMLGKNSGYVWVGSDGMVQSGSYTNSTNGAVIPDLAVAELGLIGTSPPVPSDEFTALWNTYYPGTPINIYSPYSYDCVMTYAHAIAAMLTDNQDPRNGSLLLNYIKSVNFTGATGTVVIDSSGDRAVPNYGILNLVNINNTNVFVQVGAYRPSFINSNATTNVNSAFAFNSRVIWPSGSVQIPNIPIVQGDLPDTVWIEWGSPVGIAMLVLNGLMALATICVLVYVVVAWAVGSLIMRESGLLYNVVILTGILVSCAAVTFWTGEPNPGVCAARPWWALCFWIIYINLFGKIVFVVFQHFYNKEKSTMHINFGRTPVGMIQMAVLNVIIIVLELTLLVAWTAGDRPKPEITATSGNDNQKLCSSHIPPLWYTLQYTMVGIVLVVGIIMAGINTRLSTMWAEGITLGVAFTGVSLVVVATLIATHSLVSTPVASYAVLFSGILIANAVILVVVYGTKMVNEVQHFYRRKTRGSGVTVGKDLAGAQLEYDSDERETRTAQNSGVDLAAGDDGLDMI
eukprot:TRINITY_DN1131_c0_g1_i1.p1 TRINITY_DN1131_c0_g1~~TRINITY_DN1131_c0_g1_i1.p1  ORF type:complete len:795 (+),score=101.70 TRINITY_DN1131_c0_g1_i1:133-2517(+)